MLKLLFVEDDFEAVEPILNALRKECDCKSVAFDDAEATLRDFIPDIVVLDILEGGSTSEAEPSGKTIYDTIWNQRFCPIVVYSAQPELLSSGIEEHPFVRYVRKGRNSHKELKDILGEFRPHVQAIRDAEIRMRTEYSLALREVASDAFRFFTNENERKDAIVRTTRRRFAALMDDLSRHGECLKSWEQYLCPPVSEDLTLGDIIRAKDENGDDPSSFSLVLTPSCDLVASADRSPKVADVLVAQCERIAVGIKVTTLGNLSKSKLRERLPSELLSQGFRDGIIPLPKLEGRIPTMAANLKKLKLVPLSHLAGEKRQYERVASIDSPFRELVSWAYSQTACRPGLPDRDFESWRNEIIQALEDGAES